MATRRVPAKALTGSGLVPEIGPRRARHLALANEMVAMPDGLHQVTVDTSESPLAWLARRRGRNGETLIAPHQFQAGERLRVDFTHAQMMPRVTADWSNPLSSGRRGSSNLSHAVDATIAARQAVGAALDAVGPEFSGLLIDLCCFLKGLEDIEKARDWPARSGKVVVRLALDRLARHYGYAAAARGRRTAPIRTWLADGAGFRVE